MTNPPAPGDEGALRALVPRVLATMVRRGEDFDAAEDALQDALIEALRVWPEHPPRDARAWLTTVATRRLVDARRSEAARRRREEASRPDPLPAVTGAGDDTLFLLFCCCHPDLAPASQVALSLRAVGGLTTRQIADAFYVPEPTMAQRISRAKRTLRGRPLDQPGDLAVVLRVLYLAYTAGHAGRVDLAEEAIRLARQLTLATDEPEARGLLALMLLNHARAAARRDPDGRIVTLDRQDRVRWDTREIAEGVRVLQSALAVGRPGRYQIEAAISALHDDAATAEETDWEQILAWYDDLVALHDDPVHQDPAAVLGRAVAVGHVRGAPAGLRETDRLREVLGERHRWYAVRGYLHELDGDLAAAAAAYAEASRRATDVAERDHLVRQAARARAEVSLTSREATPASIATMRVFLAGASGVLGRALIPLLVEAGHEVLGTTRSPGKAADLTALGATPVVCDVYDADRLVAVVAAFAPDVVLHELTDLPDTAADLPARREGNARIRIEGTRNLLRAARASGAPRFLAQSVAWDMAPGSGAAAVGELESTVLEYGGVVLRYGQLYGPGTFYEDELPAEPRVSVVEAAARTVGALDAPSGVLTITD